MNRTLLRSDRGAGRTNRTVAFLPHDVFTAPKAERPTVRYISANTFLVLVGTTMVRGTERLTLVLLNTNIGWVDEDAVSVQKAEATV